METRPRHRSALRAAALACIGVALAPGAARAQALPRSISTSRQFIVEAADGQLRGALCNYAEETRARVFEFLGRPRTWRYPIGIVARTPVEVVNTIRGLLHGAINPVFMTFIAVLMIAVTMVVIAFTQAGRRLPCRLSAEVMSGSPRR